MLAQMMQGTRRLFHLCCHRPTRQAVRALLAALVVVTLLPAHSYAAQGWGLVNGSFENGFVAQEDCRWRSDLFNVDVGAGWHCFHNKGAARYGFYADQWAPVVADGSTSQLIEINTWGLQHGDNDRYAGIYQTVKTVPGHAYRLSLRGMIRTTGLEGDEWRYRVQVGFSEGASGEWREVGNWQDVGWDTYYPRTEPGQFSDFQTIFTPSSKRTTIFIRVWKKWGITNEEIDVNLDAISLVKLEK